jgi:hypothetical protein
MKYLHIGYRLFSIEDGITIYHSEYSFKNNYFDMIYISNDKNKFENYFVILKEGGYMILEEGDNSDHFLLLYRDIYYKFLGYYNHHFFIKEQRTYIK